MTGASGRLWLTNDGRGRIELQSDAGDVQIVWNDDDDLGLRRSSNTVYRADLPAQRAATARPARTRRRRSRRSTRSWPSSACTGRSPARSPTDVGGQPAYSVSVSPKHDGGLLGSRRARLGRRAAACRSELGVYAQGSVTPVLELDRRPTSRTAPVADGDVDVAPPAGAKVVDLGTGSAKPRPAARARRRSPGSTRSRQPPASRSSRPTRSSGCRGRTSGSSAATTALVALRPGARRDRARRAQGRRRRRSERRAVEPADRLARRR